MTPYVLFVLALYAASLWQAASFSLLGCPSDPSVRAASQSRMKALLLDLLATATSTRAPGEKKHDMLEQEHLKLLEQLVNEHTGTAGVVHEPSRATGYATTGLPLPCVPGIVATEFLQLLWVWKKQGDASEAGAVIQQSDRHFAFLRISPWINILNLGYGLTFAAGQALCHLVPSPPEKIDFDRAARRYHLAWPGSTTTEATTFKQYHVLTGCLEEPQSFVPILETCYTFGSCHLVHRIWFVVWVDHVRFQETLRAHASARYGCGGLLWSCELIRALVLKRQGHYY